MTSPACAPPVRVRCVDAAGASAECSSTDAVLRGVDVRLVVPQQADQILVCLAQRSFYEELLEAGLAFRGVVAASVEQARVQLLGEDLEHAITPVGRRRVAPRRAIALGPDAYVTLRSERFVIPVRADAGAS